jgi:hypothetical protein
MRRLVVAGMLIALVAGCGDDGGGPEGPKVPTGLTAEGSLGLIALAWDAFSADGLTGYNVYRGADGGAFAKINADPVAGLGYQDTVVADGEYYSYKITGVGTEESDFSAVVRSMHGTRLNRHYDAGCQVAADGLAPYVAEDTVTVAGGPLEIQPGARLYVLDDAVVDLEFVSLDGASRIQVDGLLRVVSSASAPAKLTAHKAGGALADGEGFAIAFGDQCDDYDPGDGSGTLVGNCIIENLQQGNFAVFITASSPRIYNSKISSTRSTGGSYFEIDGGAAPTIENCLVTRMVLTVRTDLRGTGAAIRRNRCRGGYYDIYFSGGADPRVDAGQVAYNDLGVGLSGIYLWNVTGTEDVPLGNNYWTTGPPVVIQGGTTTVTVDFAPTLDEPPADCGPTW